MLVTILILINRRRKINELEFELLADPAYCPDLAHLGYHLFYSMAHFLEGGRLVNIDDVENYGSEFFASKEGSWYRRGIELLLECWQKAIEQKEFYFKD